MPDAVFQLQGERFLPTARAGSPWGDNLVHGGPPAGLLARAIERFVDDPEMQVSRLTVDLFRPVPAVPLAVTARSVRAGKRIHAVEASLIADDTEVCRASGLLLRRTEQPIAVDREPPPPGPEGIVTGSLGGDRRPRPENWREGFHTTVAVRWVTRPPDGPPTAWFQIPIPFVEGEATSPLVRIAALADFVNPISGGGASSEVSFINTDSTIYLARVPVGEWICLQVERTVEPAGIGVASARLYDEEGFVGRGTQAVLANRRR